MLLFLFVLAWLLFQLLWRFSRAELTFKVPIIATENANEMQNVPSPRSAGVCVLIALHSPVEPFSECTRVSGIYTVGLCTEKNRFYIRKKCDLLCEK